jgi:tetratricopeptide (TPR) repeat protein
MSAENRFSRASFLMGQSRYDMAEVELRKALLDEPDDATMHACLAICLSQRGRFLDATEEAQTAIRLAPDDSFSFYALACAHISRERWKEAEAAIVEAIRLDPFDEDNFAVQARVLLEQEKWQAALDAAEQGLNIEPDHVTCLNSRALALRRLGREDPAGESLQAAMQHEPEDAYTHCNVGWGYLEARDYEKAVVHFREALRLEPELDSAREGMLAVLRAKNWFYRMMLPVLFWLGKKSAATQWMLSGVGLALYIGLDQLADRSPPAVAVWLRPLQFLFAGCFWATWVAEPLLNLLVRASPEGRRFLSENDVQKANWCAILIVPGLVFFALAVLLSSEGMFFRAGMLICLVLVVSEVFEWQNPWVRTRMIIFASCVVAIGMIGMLLVLYAPLVPEALRPLARRVRLPMMMGALICCMVADNVAQWLTRNAPYRE